VILIENREVFLKSFKSYHLFEFVFENPEKINFIKKLSMNFAGFDYINNWDALLDVMRGFYKLEKDYIIIIIETKNKDNVVFGQFDSIVDDVNEFLKSSSKKIIFALKIG